MLCFIFGHLWNAPFQVPEDRSEPRMVYDLHSAQHHLPQTPTLLITLHSGVGVGDSTATPTTALLLSVLQESTGRIATILFAHRLGTALEPECKMFRLAADIFNDTAMVLDCLSPGFPKPIRVAVLSFSSCLRALCGVCAGSAKASLSAHFAKKGNLGEVNAVSFLHHLLHFSHAKVVICTFEEFLLVRVSWRSAEGKSVGLDRYERRISESRTISTWKVMHERFRARLQAGGLTHLPQKDSSQETVISLLGMLVSKLPTPRSRLSVHCLTAPDDRREVWWSHTYPLL